MKSLSAVLLSMSTIVTVAPFATHAAPPGQTTFTENFENGNNTGGWTFGNVSFETIEAAGGNPGAFYHNFFLDTFAPQPRTTGAGSPFTGDYRARDILSVGIDLVLFAVDFSSQGRPLSVILESDNNTPADPTDDCSVYFTGTKPAPLPDGHWRGYSFRVPSGSLTLPNRWAVLSCAGRADDEAWNLTITDVDELRFFVGDPTLFFIFQVWDIGMDNPTITSGTPE